MEERQLFLLLQDGHFVILRTHEADNGTLLIHPAMEDWRRFTDPMAFRKYLGELYENIPPAQTTIQVISDEDMHSTLMELFKEGFGILAYQWQFLPWQGALPASGGAFDYPLPSLDAVVAALGGEGGATADTVATAAVASSNPNNSSVTTPESRPVVEIKRTDCDTLIHFLPALYINVFSHVSPVDLALLNNDVIPCEIPSPYQEPGEGVLLVLQREFLTLPEAVQLAILGVIERLPSHSRPKARPAMQSHINHLLLIGCGR